MDYLDKKFEDSPFSRSKDTKNTKDKKGKHRVDFDIGFYTARCSVSARHVIIANNVKQHGAPW